MVIDIPKFMENKDWYYEDLENPIYKKQQRMCYRLTNKAPKDAVESYLPYCTAIYNYSLGYVPKFVEKEYKKHMSKFLK